MQHQTLPHPPCWLGGAQTICQQQALAPREVRWLLAARQRLQLRAEQLVRGGRMGARLVRPQALQGLGGVGREGQRGLQARPACT